MDEKMSRRSFLKLIGASGGVLLLASCSGESGELSFLDRLQGNPMTPLPAVENAWSYENATLALDLSKLPELEQPGSAVRIEGEVLSEPILIVFGDDGNYYAFNNACTHGGRKIDPIAGTMTLECCSVSGSKYDYQGNVLSGPAKGPITSYPLEMKEDILLVNLS